MEEGKPRPLKLRFQTQNPNEKVYSIYRRAFITNVPWITASFIGLAIPVIFLKFNLNRTMSISPGLLSVIFLFWYLALIGYGLDNIAKWYFQIFLITDSRVLDIDLNGLLYRDVAETHLYQIQDVSHTQGGPAQLLFNYGDIYIQTAATKQNIEIKDVPQPGKIHDLMTDLAAETHRHRKRQ